MLFVPFPRLQLFLLSRKLRAGRAARVTVGVSRRNSLALAWAKERGSIIQREKNALSHSLLFLSLTGPAAGKMVLGYKCGHKNVESVKLKARKDVSNIEQAVSRRIQSDGR